MDTNHVLEAVRDSRGSHVIEAFLISGAPGKQKRRLVTKLQGHFGEVALNSSGVFTIDKCFTACNLSLRETIVSEILAVRNELSKTKQGIYLLRKLDVDGFAASPDHWRLKQTSKESTYKEFYATFGSSDTRSTKNDGFLADTSNNNKSNPNNVKEMRKEIDQSLGSSFLSSDGFNKNQNKTKQKHKKNVEISGNEDNSSRKKKRSKKEKVESGYEAATETAKKRERNRDVSETPGKKLKTSD